MGPKRFSIRSALVAIAIVSLALGIEVGRRRRSEFLRLARDHELAEGLAITCADAWKSAEQKIGEIARSSNLDMAKESVEEARRVVRADLLNADYHERMKEKYLRASKFPFLSVAPDPVEPPLMLHEVSDEPVELLP